MGFYIVRPDGDERLHDEIAEMFDGLDGHGGCAQYVFVPETGTLTEERSEAQKLNLGYGKDD
jgi:hypothetical protein